MRRPAQTQKQRQHARQMRALLRLRRAVVRRSLAAENVLELVEAEALADLDAACDAYAEALADLDAACDAYTNTLTTRERRKLSK